MGAQKDGRTLETRKDLVVNADVRRERLAPEPQKENVPLEVTRHRQNAEKENQLKRKVSARRSQILCELGGDNVGGSTSIGGAMDCMTQTSAHSSTSTIPVFVDDEFAHHDCQHAGALPASGGVQYAQAIAELSCDNRSVVHTLTRRLDAMRAFKGHLAAGNLQSALSAVSSCRDWWSRHDVNRFRSVLLNAKESSAMHHLGTATELELCQAIAEYDKLFEGGVQSRSMFKELDN